MPTVNGVSIGFCVSAIVLVGALTMLPVFAEDAGSSRARDAAPRHNSSDDARGNAAKPDQPAPRGDKITTPEGQRSPSDSNATVRNGKTPDDIDTRNDVRPRRLNAKPNTIGEINAGPLSPAVKNLHRRLFQPQATPPRVVRNSIGVPLPPREGGERRDGGRPDAFGVPHGPVFETPGVRANAPRRLSKTDWHFDRAFPNANPPYANPNGRPIGPNHAAVNGTGVVHHGFGPPRIGGPTTVATGINGTTIRRQH